jgi:hypothetical protein
MRPARSALISSPWRRMNKSIWSLIGMLDTLKCTNSVYRIVTFKNVIFHLGFNGFHSYFSFRPTPSRMTYGEIPSHALKKEMRFGGQCLLECLSLRDGIIICGQVVTKPPYHNLFFFAYMIVFPSSELLILSMVDEEERL